MWSFGVSFFNFCIQWWNSWDIITAICFLNDLSNTLKKINCKMYHRMQIENEAHILFFQSFALPVLPPDAWASHLGNYIAEKNRILAISEQLPDSRFFRQTYLNLTFFLPPVGGKKKKGNEELRSVDLGCLQGNGFISLCPVGGGSRWRGARECMGSWHGWGKGMESRFGSHSRTVLLRR